MADPTSARRDESGIVGGVGEEVVSRFSNWDIFESPRELGVRTCKGVDGASGIGRDIALDFHIPRAEAGV